jgi:hypothetical protein
MMTRNPLGTSLDGFVWPGDEAVARLMCGQFCHCAGDAVRCHCPINEARAIFKLIHDTSAAPLNERAVTAVSMADKLRRLIKSIGRSDLKL